VIGVAVCGESSGVENAAITHADRALETRPQQGVSGHDDEH
jgi:hypothetical protein